VIITDKLKSYSAAKAEIMPGVEHRQHKGLNNHAENRASADQSTRESHETIQVSRARTTVPLSLWDYLFALPTTQTPADSRALPGRDGVEIRDVERGELRWNGGLKRTRVDP